MSERVLTSMPSVPGLDGRGKHPGNMTTGSNALAQFAGSDSLNSKNGASGYTSSSNAFKENTSSSAATFNATKEASTFQHSENYSSSESIESSSESLGIALTQIPWMRFKVIAEPDMTLFARDPRLQAFIRSITQTTVTSVSQEIVNEFRSKLEQLTQSMDTMVSARMASVTETVIERITSLTNVQGTVTQFQNLDINEQLGFAGANVGGGFGGVAIVGATANGGPPQVGAQAGAVANGSPQVAFGAAANANGARANTFNINNNSTNNATGGQGGSGGNANVDVKVPVVINNYVIEHKFDCPNKKGGKGGCPCPISNTCPRLDKNQRPVKADPPDLATANWIWTKEVKAGPVLGCARPFRRVLRFACPVDSITIDITCDNFYTLYVNGKLVGTGTNWGQAQRYTVTFDDVDRVVVAVYAVQDPVSVAQVGLICSGVVWNSKARDPSSTAFHTDASWRTQSKDGADPAFIKPEFDDDNWEYAVEEGGFTTTPPWAGLVVKPTSEDRDKPTAWPGLLNVPAAPNARPATFFGANK